MAVSIMSAQEREPIVLRCGRSDDCEDIARLASIAGGDTVGFILKGLHPTAEVLPIYRTMIAQPDGIFSFRNCIVAQCLHRVVGIANAFPAQMIRKEVSVGQLTDRELFLRARTELNEWDSYLLNNIAVEESCRRVGVGSLLMKRIIAQAKGRGFPSITLHVWADNKTAIAFYRRFGFRRVGHAPIPWHIDLPHEGGSLLLRRSLHHQGWVRAV